MRSPRKRLPALCAFHRKRSLLRENLMQYGRQRPLKVGVVSIGCRVRAPGSVASGGPCSGDRIGTVEYMGAQQVAQSWHVFIISLLQASGALVDSTPVNASARKHDSGRYFCCAFL